MPAITLKDIPRALHRDLKARAKANRRSLNQEVIVTLESATQGGRAHSAAAEQKVTEARGAFKRALRITEIAKWKRQGRE